MSFLNTQDRSALLSFLDVIADYLPTEELADALALIENAESENSLSSAELAGRVLQYAVLAWPARRAVQRFVGADGAEAEWQAVSDAVRPTTAYLLKRVREQQGLRTLGQLMESEEAASAIHGSERTEIELLRPEIWIELWSTQPDALQTHAQEAQKELEAMHQRLQKLERFSADSGKKDELLKKVREFQDRIYFSGETISLEKLDEELQLTIGDVLGQ